MTLQLAGALQAALYASLSSDPEIVAEVGTGIFDAAPDGPLDGRSGAYLLIGETRLKPRSSQGAPGAWHDLEIEVVSDALGFAEVKRIGQRVATRLEAGLTVPGGTVCDLRFLGARARRDAAPERRRLRLTFRAFVEEE